jgi:pilus assembly protein CpaE
VQVEERQLGQATVEFVVLLPVVMLVAGCLWQAALAGEAAWLAPSAARAAARAHAVGHDPERAARAVLPAALERGLSVSAGPAGAVRVGVRVPTIAGRGNLGIISARASFAKQAP